jgi:cytochrome P450 PksS
MLRWTSPVQWPSPRFNLEDIELSGISIPAGSRLYPGLASANRDERFFDNPDKLDITRQPEHKHLALGMGAHYCIGAPLARLEGATALRVLMERCPNLQLAIDPDDVRWANSPTIRGLEALPVRCG